MMDKKVFGYSSCFIIFLTKNTWLAEDKYSLNSLETI